LRSNAAIPVSLSVDLTVTVGTVEYPEPRFVTVTEVILPTEFVLMKPSNPIPIIPSIVPVVVFAVSETD